MDIAVLGLGSMGAPIARRIEAAGIALTVYNRSAGPEREFRERGASVGATPAEAAAGADVCITMLADGAAVETVLSDALEARPKTIVDMSTIDVATSERVSAAAAQAGVAYLRAPVSGNPGVVAAGRLVILASGPRDAFDAVRPVLEAIGPTVFHLGEGEEARVMKLALNLMVAGTMQLLAEALALGEGHGLARGQMLDVIGGSVVGSPFVHYKAEPLARDDYSATFTARLMHKDLGLVMECADAAGVPVPVASTVQQLLRACIGTGLGELDFAVLAAKLQRDAGLRPT